MAVSDVIKGAQAPAQAPVQAPVQAPTAKAASANAIEVFKNSGREDRKNYTEDQKAAEGSKSGTVEFICALGDPNRKQPRVEGKQSLDSYVVVGYKFKVLEDVEVPYAPLMKDEKTGSVTPLSVQPISSRPVKAGEIVNLNLVETADFISRIEYAGTFEGGGKGVTLSAKISKQNDAVPLPILLKTGSGSIKEGMELIADMVGADPANKVKGTPVVKAEYKEAFGILYEKKSISRGGAGAGVVNRAGESAKDLAAAFRSIYANKRA